MSASKLSQYAVRPCPYSRKGWSIVNRITGVVMEGGFFSKARAEEYIWREYEKEETV